MVSHRASWILLSGILLSAQPSQAQSSPQGYTLIGAPENKPFGGAPRRFVVRIHVPYGRTRAEVRELLERVAIEQQRTLKANAVTVFAYRPGDTGDGAYSVGRAVVAPHGEWARAAERGPMIARVDLEDAYFAGDPNQATGQTKVLVSEGRSKTIFLSRRFESWGDADLVANVPAGTAVEILETRTSGPSVTRYRVRARVRGKAVQGWVFDSDVR